MSATARPTRSVLGPVRERVLHRRIRLVLGITVAYDVAEAMIAIPAGSAASSAALVALGLDSVVEVLSATAVAWQLAGPVPRAASEQPSA